MSVLITGASGAICKQLSHKLKKNNVHVNFLTANLNKTSDSQNIYYWNTEKMEIDDRAFDGVKHIVHLAGAGIADARWSKERKHILKQSRVGGAQLLLDSTKRLNKTIKKYISAGAIGIFDENIMQANEQSKQGSDFMAQLCKEWEESIIPFQEEGIPTTLFRTGIVLEKESGFYKQIAQLAKYFVAAVPGNGKQWVSWIGMEDMVDMYYAAITDESVQGTYNATSPNPVLLKEMIQGICKTEGKPLLLPNIPSFVLKLLYGEMAQVILSSKHVIPVKWQAENRTIKHKTLKEALLNL